MIGGIISERYAAVMNGDEEGTEGNMNLDSLEGSIQNLLSVLYPPFEATAPTVLSQLFQIIDDRYQGDALRCLLDFLVPAKHILDCVQQTACAQYSDAVFVCEGWPLCLHDQVVIHLAPIDPNLLQPGDFYLQVTPFCDQSARIVVCSLLEEEELRVEVVEETPIPETSYPCIFSLDWLEDFNQGRHGTSLSQCLLATEHGVVRLPWKLVAVPDFVELPQHPGSSMASASPSCPPLPPQLPPSPHLSCLPKNSSSNTSFLLPPSEETPPQNHPIAIQHSAPTSSSHPSTFSVETRICPAKHGIAVSLCLVDTSSASASRLIKVKETEAETKPIGWVSPNTWDSRFTGAASKNPSTSGNTYLCNDAEEIQSENKTCNTILKDPSRSELVGQIAAEGDYIDVLQATMLFGQVQLQEEHQKSEVKMQPRTYCEAQVYTHRQAQMQPPAQMESYVQTSRHLSTQMPQKGQSQAHSHTKEQKTSERRTELADSLRPKKCAETGPSSLHHSQPCQPHPDSSEHSQCVRTVRFSEKPCTPCMRRRQGAKVSRAQELRCRYRDSYQAALQNPVAFGQQRGRENMLDVVEEDGNFSQCEERQRPQGTGNPWYNVQEICCGHEVQNQSPSSFSVAICKESGEKNTAPCWKIGATNSAPCMDFRSTNTLRFATRLEPTTQWTSVPYMEPRDGHYGKSDSSPGMRMNSSRVLQATNDPKQSGLIPRLPYDGEITDINNVGLQNMNISTVPRFCKPLSVQQSRRESLPDGRSSSLSTAVVDTSEKCDLVIVEGQKVRRRENADSCAEIPQLHVVKCKKSTAFGLVSPKINRRKLTVPDGAQTISGGNNQQVENPRVRPTATEAQKTFQHPSSHPRPDHLPLGNPDPRAHPLYQGVGALTGGKDRTGRAIVEFYGDHQGWRGNVTSQEVLRMLLYFHSIIRREIREAGMTLIFDARKTHPPPQLYKALMTLQEENPLAVSSLVLLVDKDSSIRPERCPGIQTEVVTSMRALLKLVEDSQRSSRLEGTLPHSHYDWMELHQKLFPFVSDLHEASSLLLRAISKLEDPQRLDTVQTVQQCMMDQRILMRDVLEDSRLVGLQREGGAILARLRKESDLKYPQWEDLSDAVDSLTSLYNHVEEQAHILVQRSNVSLEHLEYLLQVREMEGHCAQIQQWFNMEGEGHLLEAETVEDSGDHLEQILNSFTGFLIEASDRRHHAMSLTSEAERLQQAGPCYPETEAFRTLVSSFKTGLEDFMSRAEACGRELQIMVNVCDFCEQATTLAHECTEYLDQSQSRNLNMQDNNQSEMSVNQSNPPTHQHNQDHGPNVSHPCQYEPVGAHSSGPASILLSNDDSSILQTFQDRFLLFSPEKFQEVKAQASALKGSRGMRIWNAAWLRCQEARQQLQERLYDADDVYPGPPLSNSWSECHYVDVGRTNVQASPGGQNLVVQSTPGPRHPQWEGIVSGAVDLGRTRPVTSNSTTGASSSIKPEDQSDTGTSQGPKVTPQSSQRSAKRIEKETRRRQASRARSERDAAALSQSHTVGCQWFPWGRSLGVRSVSQDSCATGAATAGSSTPSEQRTRSPSSCSHHGQPSCRILQEAQKFQISRHGSFCSEDSCMSDRGAAGGNRLLSSKHSSLPVGRYEGAFCVASPKESTSSTLRLQRVLEELVFTEREYVRSLGYILTHYLPLLDRPDIPQDLRGKRGVIFGNLEKLYDFHSHYFLPELEACQREPAMVARCFLRHSENFGLYALYSKNKPRSDALILHRRHDIFKRKQQELGDMMDLSSYLLRPIQRISKYSLLLQDMLSLAGSYRPKDMIQDTLLASSGCVQSVCGPGVYVPELTSSEREREKAEIQAAADLVRFQMRHGNDLLTMDAIRDCDVNLKEQGQLIRQDEFTVFFRKKKCIRRIFLFEDLVLFSKTKKTEIGNDVYIYKQSFKTSDIGMTHNSGMSGLCFEIWFRRRKSEDTYTLKASSMEVKKAWTTDLERILWDQAAHSRELRLQERVFMGMGRKPFMDIQPSDAAICDRAVNCVLPGRNSHGLQRMNRKPFDLSARTTTVPVTCCSHRGLEYMRPHSIGSGSTASTTISQSSSSSGRGSLPPAGYPGNQSHGLDTSPVICSTPEAVTDNEINNHHLHQHHLHHDFEHWKSVHHPLSLVDTTESSTEGINLLSSDRSCLSAIGGEVVESSSSFVTQSSKQPSPLCRTPSLRITGSPAHRKKTIIAPKPPNLTNSQNDEIIIGKSTEV